MKTVTVTDALSRMKDVLIRRPSFGLQPDSGAIAEWQSGLCMASSHPNGAQFLSDMPAEFGGAVGCVSPGWFLRAGVAACTGTCILIRAAAQNIELSKLKVEVTGKSDNRGLFGIKDEDDLDVNAAPVDLQISVEIASALTSDSELEALVQEAYRCSYAAQGLARSVPVTLRVSAQSS